MDYQYGFHYFQYLDNQNGPYHMGSTLTAKYLEK